MKQVKMFLLSMVAVMAIGAVGASAASAHNANHANVTVNGPNGPASCALLFDKTNWTTTTPEYSTDISNIRVDPNGLCDVIAISGSGTLTKDTSGNARLEGTITVDTEIEIFGFPVEVSCTYDPVGTDVSGTRTIETDYKAFDLAGEAPLSSGSFGCPDPGEITEMVIHTDKL